MSYEVVARRWARGWELDIDGETVTQSHGLTDAETMIRDWLAITGHADAATAELTWTYDIGDVAIQDELVAARAAVRAAARAQVDAADRTRKVVAELIGRGFKGAEVATITGLSKQRISQLVRG